MPEKQRHGQRNPGDAKSRTRLSDFTSLHSTRRGRGGRRRKKEEVRRKGRVGKGMQKKIGGEKEKGGKKKESKEVKFGTM